MLTIGRLARKTGVSTDCVRFYERVGLLAASGKTSSGYRLYDDDCVRRVSFIKQAQRCGFSLPEIRELLQADGGVDRAAGLRLALDKTREINETLTVLSAMKETLTGFIDACKAHPADAGRGSRMPEGSLVSSLAAQVARLGGESNSEDARELRRYAAA